MKASAPPIIVLVRPQLGQNIGKAARAMLNFGLTEMRLVEPRDGWPNPDSGPAASGADVVLERARVFDTVLDAIADCSKVYASTVRRRELVMPVVTPQAMAGEIAGSKRTPGEAPSTNSTAAWARTSGAAPRARSTAANTAPASTASAARARVSDFGLQLRAKQKLKGYYGDVTEKQFKRTYTEAAR
jgi:hypothetical protein